VTLLTFPGGDFNEAIAAAVVNFLRLNDIMYTVFLETLLIVCDLERQIDLYANYILSDKIKNRYNIQSVGLVWLPSKLTVFPGPYFLDGLFLREA